MTNSTLRWIGLGLGALFGATVVMLVRSARGASGASGGGAPLPGVDRSEAESLTPDWTEADFKALAELAARRKMSPADLLLVMTSESGLKPYAANRNAEGYPVAVGLIQFTSAANDAIGVTEGERVELVRSTVAEQLPLVDRMFGAIGWTKAGKTYDSAGVVYEAIFAPARMTSRGTTPDVILYTEADDPAAYRGNPGFDREKKGYITVGDLIDHLRVVAEQPVYLAGLQRLRDATGDSTLSPQLPTE